MAEVGFAFGVSTRLSLGLELVKWLVRYLPCVHSCVLGRADVDDDGDIPDQLRHCSQAGREA